MSVIRVCFMYMFSNINFFLYSFNRIICGTIQERGKNVVQLRDIYKLIMASQLMLQTGDRLSLGFSTWIEEHKNNKW